MIRAVYRAEGDTHSLSVCGHAGYAEHGKDIVCSAVSALVQSLIYWIEENSHTPESVSIDDGEVIITASGGEDIKAVFEMAVWGIERIAEAYPKCVYIVICNPSTASGPPSLSGTATGMRSGTASLSGTANGMGQ